MVMVPKDTHQMDGVFGEELLSFILSDRCVNDDILALLPVDGCGHTVLIRELKSYEQWSAFLDNGLTLSSALQSITLECKN